MEERIDNETVQQIDLISMLKDIGREWLTILLLAIAAALFADIWDLCDLSAGIPNFDNICCYGKRDE